MKPVKRYSLRSYAELTTLRDMKDNFTREMMQKDVMTSKKVWFAYIERTKLDSYPNFVMRRKFLDQCNGAIHKTYSEIAGDPTIILCCHHYMLNWQPYRKFPISAGCRWFRSIDDAIKHWKERAETARNISEVVDRANMFIANLKVLQTRLAKADGDIAQVLESYYGKS
jgi:hypothetical protein